MRLFPAFRRRLPSCLAASIALIVAGCASYGTFDENEPGIEESILGDFATAVGGGSSQPEITYDQRAPLVAPPNADRLPSPQAQGATTTVDPSWPQGTEQRLEQASNATDQTLVFTPGTDGIDIAATQALAERPRSSNDYPGSDGSILTPQQMQQGREAYLRREEARQANANGIRERRFLTDPPVEARAPAPDVGYVEPEEENNGFDWWPFN